MTWNWQKKDWPNFHWNAELLAEFEEKFLHQSGILIGTSRHFDETEKNQPFSPE